MVNKDMFEAIAAIWPVRGAIFESPFMSKPSGSIASNGDSSEHGPKRVILPLVPELRVHTYDRSQESDGSSSFHARD